MAVAAESEADGGRTVKLLCRLADGQTVETVAMETPARPASRRRSTVCVSTQVGCAVGCPFCATGRMGLRRSCTAAEVVDQVRAAATALHARGLGPVTHVVYMGMGEPLAAYDTTVGSLRVLVADGGISPRRITVSTSGVVPAIRRLAAEGIGCTLAVSLHAATDELRDRLVPLNRAHPLAELVDAATAYARTTGRRLTFEWCLIGGVNDSIEQARGLREHRPPRPRARQRHPHEPHRRQPVGAAGSGHRARLPRRARRRRRHRPGHPRLRHRRGLRPAPRRPRAAPQRCAPTGRSRRRRARTAPA